MNFYSFVFVVLIYRNYSDLKELMSSICQKIDSFKCIVVDAFYDSDTSNEIKKICLDRDADYLRIENKGYSFGNNFGIEYALKTYSFEYLVVSNPDIVIKNMPLNVIKHYKNCVLGPKIINLRKKNQNPMYYRNCVCSSWFIYKGLKTNTKIVFFFGLFLNKILKKLHCLFNLFKKSIEVYQLHGSFIIFHKNVLKKNYPVFDNNMFLFAEESCLAFVLKQNSIKSFYDKRIEVAHKEDGSMKFRNDISAFMRDSNIYFFENYYGFGKKGKN